MLRDKRLFEISEVKITRVNYTMKRNVVTGHETWVHYFEPIRKVSSKIWAIKNSKSPVIAKCMLNAKKVLYAIFCCSEGVAMQVPVKKGRCGTKEIEKNTIRNSAQSWVSNMLDF